MIVLNVRYKCKPGVRKKFLEMIKAEGIDAASQAESGNDQYQYYLSVDEENELFLVEKWANAEALASHSEQPHFKRLGALKAEYVTETIIERYET